MTRSIYSDYRLNDLVVTELLSRQQMTGRTDKSLIHVNRLFGGPLKPPMAPPTPIPPRTLMMGPAAMNGPNPGIESAPMQASQPSAPPIIPAGLLESELFGHERGSRAGKLLRQRGSEMTSMRGEKDVSGQMVTAPVLEVKHCRSWSEAQGECRGWTKK